MSVPNDPNSVQRDRKFDRRTLLASAGLAGVALATGGMFSNIASANGQQDKTKPKVLTSLNYCIATTVSELRNLSDPDSQFIYYVTDSGMEGHFYYDLNDTISVDNTGTVIVSAAGARFKRIYDEAVNVRWFGAEGNGVADDTSAIQAAIDIEETVYIPNTDTSVYLISDTIKIPSNRQIIFANGVTLKLKNNVNKIMIQNSDITNGNNNIAIIGGKLDANKQNQSGGADFATIQLTKVSRSLFQNLIVKGSKFIDYYFGSAGWDMLYCDNNKIYDCELYESDGEGLWLRESNHNEIVGGEYHHNLGSGVAINGGEFNLVERVYAHHAASSNLSINAKHTRVINCICDTNDTENGITFGHHGYPADYSICSGNICRNNTGQGIAVLGNTIEVICTNNRCYNNGGSGIRVSDLSKEVTVSNNTIYKNNEFGIYVGGSPGQPDVQCIIQGNLSKENRYDGIFLIDAHSCLISSNVIKNNGRFGVWLYESNTKYNTVSENRCYDDQMTKTQQRGVYIEGSMNSLTDNMLSGNKDYPYVAAAGNTIRDNKLSATEDSSAILTLTASGSTVYENNNIRADTRVTFQPISASSLTRNIVLTAIGNGNITFAHTTGSNTDQVRIFIG
ncbi:right-handed parallel beta-helix repeat-containing protein [Paenibacillus contaminans]|uniref:Right handed beta helix domain-containing protein n=1 Tax=Paenibacillus contaminans TaxID=450362 RepID=A0A329M4Y5_9BACL|nr:right-handed parallel beta-helix repeat-containing protein [Paenibacillus contaminans]RAV14860.1 hypothetical protein DQG23_31000 [Paenibacillus contaminans]